MCVCVCVCFNKLEEHESLSRQKIKGIFSKKGKKILKDKKKYEGTFAWPYSYKTPENGKNGYYS